MICLPVCFTIIDISFSLSYNRASITKGLAFSFSLKENSSPVNTFRGSLLSEYQTEQLKLQKQKEEKILSDGRLKTETVITRLAEVAQPDTKGFRKQQVLKLTDITKIPQKYFHLDESQLLADLKAGEKVEGAEIDVKMIPVGR